MKARSAAGSQQQKSKSEANKDVDVNQSRPTGRLFHEVRPTRIPSLPASVPGRRVRASPLAERKNDSLTDLFSHGRCPVMVAVRYPLDPRPVSPAGTRQFRHSRYSRHLRHFRHSRYSRRLWASARYPRRGHGSTIVTTVTAVTIVTAFTGVARYPRPNHGIYPDRHAVTTVTLVTAF